MTTFHSRQSNRGRRVHKKADADTFNFTSQIPPSICTVMFTEHDKSGATVFKSLCKRMAVSKCFYRVEALPLSQLRFFSTRHLLADGCAESRETVARWARNIRQEIRRNVSRHVRATSRQWPDSGSSNAAERPSRRLARQLVLRRTWTRNVRAGNLRDNLQLGRATAAKHLAR
jgi:hypothetical protein